MNVIGPQVLKKMYRPVKNSHKGENGQLLIIGGSRHYHGSLVFTVRMASKIVDKVHVLTTRENETVVRKLRVQTAVFIPSYDLRHGMELADCVLIGPGMGTEARTKKLVAQVLRSKRRAVLDADALNVLDKKLLRLLGPRHILTPHKGEFAKAFGLKPTSENASLMARKHSCTIVLKGQVDYVATPKGVWENRTGNEGMTKGGTGDVLAGLVAALACTNDLYTSAVVGSYVNKVAGDALYKNVGPFYNASDLVKQLPQTMNELFFARE